MDEYTRENIALEVSRKLKSHDMIMVLDELTAIRGAPENIRSDNGSEFIADVMKDWRKESETNTLYMEPGALCQNGIVEIFNSRLRDELLSSEFLRHSWRRNCFAQGGVRITTIDDRSAC